MTQRALGRPIDLKPGDVATAPNLLIVDPRWVVVVTSATNIWERAGIRVRVGEVLPSTLETIARAARESLDDGSSDIVCARLSELPAVVIAIHMAQSAGGPLIVLTAEPFRSRKSLLHAQYTYGLSPRELEILRYVLGGFGTTQNATSLSIADSTVIAHIKSLLLKTKAANRAALVARVLGWAETLAP